MTYFTQLFRRRIMIFFIVFSVLGGGLAAYLCFSPFKVDFGGGHYVGVGQIRILLQLDSNQKIELTEKELRWDSVTLNQSSSQGLEWTLCFFDVPFRTSNGSNMLSFFVEWQHSPQKNVYTNSFFSGPKLIYSIPTKGEFKFKEGKLAFDQAEFKIGGRVKGYLEFGQSDKLIHADFDLLLQNSPPIFPVPVWR